MRPHTLLRRALVALTATAASASWAGNLNVTVLDAQGTPLPDAVVSVYVKGVPPDAPAGAHADLAQKHRTFVPSVLAIQTGTAVHFPNFDTVRHHVYSFSRIKPFEIKLYSGTPAAPVVFDKPGTAVLGCNIHDRMAAFVHVVSTPYFGKTNAAGLVSLNVPPGQHTLQVWQAVLTDEQNPLREPVTVRPGTNQVSVRLAATWNAGTTADMPSADSPTAP